MQSYGIGTVAGVSAAAAGPLAPSWQLFREHEVARGALSRVCPEIKKCMLRASVRALYRPLPASKSRYMYLAGPWDVHLGHWRAMEA